MKQTDVVQGYVDRIYGIARQAEASSHEAEMLSALMIALSGCMMAFDEDERQRICDHMMQGCRENQPKLALMQNIRLQ